MEKQHGRKHKPDVSSDEESFCVELTCRSCDFEGKSSGEMRNHKKEHLPCKCSKCDFAAISEDILKQHIQSKHQFIQVDIHSTKTKKVNHQVVSCNQCQYKCKLNIQLKNHMKRKHAVQDMKFKCDFCQFQAGHLLKMYEHRFADHPENPFDFNPKSRSISDMVLNLLAEQNMELMEELMDLKRRVKSSFDQFSKDMNTTIANTEEITKAAYKNVDSRLGNLEHNMRKEASTPKVAQPSQQKPSMPASSATRSPPVLSSTPSSHAVPTLTPRPAHYKRKKSRFLQKPKVLYVGDSVAHNAYFANIEIETNSRIKTTKAYSSVRDGSARWPHKNITEVSQVALTNTHEEDDFSHLILGAPTVDISNLDTTKINPGQNIEAHKQVVMISCQNIFSAAQNALTKHPQLKKVVIVEHAPRFDVSDMDPTGLKPKLAIFANSYFAQLWHSSPMKDRIVIGKHSLDCSGEQISARYRNDRSGRYDGVHMYGSQGKTAYTNSVGQIIKSVLRSSQSSSSSPLSSSLHSSCPQAQYQKSQKQNTSQKYEDIYTVPVSNQFNVLGN